MLILNILGSFIAFIGTTEGTHVFVQWYSFLTCVVCDLTWRWGGGGNPEEELLNHIEFWVVTCRIPEAVFSTDPQNSLRVSDDIFLHLRTSRSGGGGGRGGGSGLYSWKETSVVVKYGSTKQHSWQSLSRNPKIIHVILFFLARPYS